MSSYSGWAVFLVRESDGECRTTGFQIFYDNNEAMQNYLLEWTGSTGKTRAAEKARTGAAAGSRGDSEGGEKANASRGHVSAAVPDSGGAGGYCDHFHRQL